MVDILGQFTSDQWTAIAAICAIVQTIIVFAGIAYAAWQLRASRRSHELAAQINLHMQIDSNEAYEDRWKLFNLLPDDLRGSDDEHFLMHRVVSEFNSLGDLVNRKIVKFELISNSHARPISRVWQRVEPWVEARRERDPQFAAAFGKLGKTCREWDERMNPGNVAVPFRRNLPAGSDTADVQTS